MAQLDFLKQALRIDSECDHEIEISSGQAKGDYRIAGNGLEDGPENIL